MCKVRIKWSAGYKILTECPEHNKTVIILNTGYCFHCSIMIPPTVITLLITLLKDSKCLRKWTEDSKFCGDRVEDGKADGKQKLKPVWAIELKGSWLQRRPLGILRLEKITEGNTYGEEGQQGPVHPVCLSTWAMCSLTENL